jgi:hypothetical protein
MTGQPQGLIGSHNFIESDSSNTRDDLYVTGNSHMLNMSLFMEWYNMATDGTFSMDLMAERAKIRLDQSKQTNPEFYYGPFTGLIARNAGYLFSGRMFRNHSAENPQGVLSKCCHPSPSVTPWPFAKTLGIQRKRLSATSTGFTEKKGTGATVRDGRGSHKTGTGLRWTTAWSS